MGLDAAIFRCRIDTSRYLAVPADFGKERTLRGDTGSHIAVMQEGDQVQCFLVI